MRYFFRKLFKNKRIELLEADMIRFRIELDQLQGEIERLKKQNADAAQEDKPTVGQIVNEWVWGEDGEQK